MNNTNDERPLVFGEVLYDHFPDDGVVLGGAPFNVAAHLQAFGIKPLLISRVGDDPLGRRIRDTMLGWGMDTSGLQLDSAHPTGTVEVKIEQGEPHFTILPEQAYDHIDASQLPPIAGCSLLYHGSLALRGATSRRALEQLDARSGAPLFMDVNLREIPVQISHEVEDTVGAGDAFSAVVILGLLRGWNPGATFRRAQDFAGAVVGIQGAVPRDRAFYDRFLDDWRTT